MNKEQFRELLHSAIAGNNESIEKIIELYTPLINRTSYIRGKIDEDLRQYLILKVYSTISKFPE